MKWTSLPCQTCQRAGSEEKQQHHVQLTIFNARCGAWLVWHGNCKSTESGVSKTVTICNGEHAHRSLCRSWKYIACPLSKRKITYVAGKHWCPHTPNFIEMPRKSWIWPLLAGIIEKVSSTCTAGYVVLCSEVTGCSTLFKMVWSGIEKVMPDFCPGLNFYFCAHLLYFNVKI